MKNNFKCLMFNFELSNSKFTIQNSQLPRSGFTMVELVFVIVVVGVLAGIGSSMMPDNKMLTYTNTATMNIKKTQKNAIGYDVNGFGTPWSADNNTTCITLDEQNLLNKNSPMVDVVSSIDRICFDEYGRPYELEHLLLVIKDINITYRGNIKRISVYPISGYVTISD